MHEERKDSNAQQKRAGVLMPVSSLPSNCGIGTLGKQAYAFIDWLNAAGMQIWQMLPLLPTGFGDSPYQSFASNALNYYFIDLDMLCERGLLQNSDYQNLCWGEDERRVDYGLQFTQKTAILRKAFANFDRTEKGWLAFLNKGEYADFALFMSLKVRFSYMPWEMWDEPFKNADAQTLALHEKEWQEEILFWQFTQYLFIEQWQRLASYAHEKGVKLMGDMPIYVSYDSVETWKYREKLFMTDANGNASLRAGVPPDAFSADGQFWGNPVYDWSKMKADGYSWWAERMRYNFRFFDIVRIDHFRAFDRFYAIPESAETAKEGEWLDGPKAEFFSYMPQGIGEIIAEDLGIIDDGVRELLAKTGFAGMKIFVFAFDGDEDNDYLPTNIPFNSVAYTGTHDNQTLRAYIEGLDEGNRAYFERTFEEQCLHFETPYVVETIEDECQSVIHLIMATSARTVIFPMQDILCMGEEARLNAPSTVSGQNWTFRFKECDLKRRKAAWLKELTEQYDR